MEPKLRFRMFKGSWCSTSLKDIASVCMCKRIFKEQTTNKGDIPFYKIGTFGSYPDSFITRQLFEEYKNKYNYPQLGDILISAAGTIGRIVEYNGEEAYYQDSNIVWLNVREKVENQFLKYYYSIIKWSGIEGSTIKRLYNNNILGSNIQYPSKEEQKTISFFFNSIEKLIKEYTKRVDSIKQIKAASLQSLFPQEGETIPKVRFKGFEGEWGKKEISQLCSKQSAHLTESTLGYNIGQYPVFGANGYIQNIAHYDMPSPYIGIIKDGSGVGRANIFPALSSILGTLTYILPKDNIDLYFLLSVFRKIDLSKYKSGSSIPHIYFKDYGKVEVLAPPTFEEQQKIGQYFENLDSQIALQSQRLEKLKQIKAACLDKMFV